MKLIHILRKRETTRFLLFCEKYLQSYTKKDIRVIKQAYDKFKDHYMFVGIMSGLKPAVLGLIGTAALGLATPENFIDWKSFVLCIAAFAGLYFKKIGPFTALGFGAIAGLLLY